MFSTLLGVLVYCIYSKYIVFDATISHHTSSKFKASRFVYYLTIGWCVLKIDEWVVNSLDPDLYCLRHLIWVYTVRLG